MCANMTDVKVRQIESSVDNLFVNNNFKCPLEVDQQTYEFPRGTGNSEIHDKWNERYVQCNLVKSER